MEAKTENKNLFTAHNVAIGASIIAALAVGVVAGMLLGQGQNTQPQANNTNQSQNTSTNTSTAEATSSEATSSATSQAVEYERKEIVWGVNNPNGIRDWRDMRRTIFQEDERLNGLEYSAETFNGVYRAEDAMMVVKGDNFTVKAWFTFNGEPSMVSNVVELEDTSSTFGKIYRYNKIYQYPGGNPELVDLDLWAYATEINEGSANCRGISPENICAGHFSWRFLGGADVICEPQNKQGLADCDYFITNMEIEKI